jgi:hypothetical protein
VNTTEQLELRAQARAAKRQADADLFRLSKRAVAAMADPVHGREVRARALGRVDLWERKRLCQTRYVDAWRAILALPTSALAAAILREDDEGVTLRQNSPFGFLVEHVAA